MDVVVSTSKYLTELSCELGFSTKNGGEKRREKPADGWKKEREGLVLGE